MTGAQIVPRRIHITGASGSGTTTLGSVLSCTLGYAHLDTDNFYWLQDAAPFTKKRPVEQRLTLLHQAFEQSSATGWVLSGSLMGWGDVLIPFFDCVIYLSAPTELRIERLRASEIARFGAESLAPGGSQHKVYQEFLAWAADYDDGIHANRSRGRHMAWLAQLTCPVLRVDGSDAEDCTVQQVLDALGQLDELPKRQ